MHRAMVHRPPSGRLRPALLALVSLSVAMGACTRRASGPSLRMAKQPAAGRPDVCPDDAVDPYGDGTPGPMDSFLVLRGTKTLGAVSAPPDLPLFADFGSAGDRDTGGGRRTEAR